MAEIKKKTIDNRIVLVQYICAFVVIMIHSINVKSWALTSPQQALSIDIQNFFHTVWLFAVPSFFFISGYFMFLNFSYDKYLNVVKKRFFTLIVPFFVWNLISYGLYLAVSNIPALSEKMNREPLPLSPVYFLKETFLGKGFAPLWYLKTLFFFAILSIVIFFLFKNKYVAAIIIAGLIVYSCLPIKHISFVEWLPMFLTGAFTGIHIKKYEFTKDKKALKIAAAIGLVTLLFFLAYFTGGITRYFYRVVSGALVPVILSSLMIKDLKLNWIFAISLFMYCTHGFILQAVQKIYLVFLGANNATSLLCYFTAPIVTTVIITVIALILHKFIPPLWKFLNGGRAS